MSQRDSAMSEGGATWRWTGRTILLTLLGFFGVIFAANGVMIYAALSTMTGLDTDSAYQAGRRFAQDAAAAKAQVARQWHVEAGLTPAGADETVDISARDAEGAPIAGLDATITFERPVDRRLDRKVDVHERGPGRFHGNVALEAGQWDLILELSRNGEQLFVSRNRIILK